MKKYVDGTYKYKNMGFKALFSLAITLAQMAAPNHASASNPQQTATVPLPLPQKAPAEAPLPLPSSHPTTHIPYCDLKKDKKLDLEEKTKLLTELAGLTRELDPKSPKLPADVLEMKKKSAKCLDEYLKEVNRSGEMNKNTPQNQGTPKTP